MEPPKRVTLNYSLKNIPIPSKTFYLKKLIEKIESVLGRMRWRAYHYLRSNKENHGEQTDADSYGLRSGKSPPYVEEMAGFEEDVAKLIEDVSFRKTHDKFQDDLRKDITHLQRSNAVFVPADKTRNLYEVQKDQYEKLLRDNITKHYRLANECAYNEINAEAQVIANQLRIADRIHIMAKKDAYVQLKDHKVNFQNSLPCRAHQPG